MISYPGRHIGGMFVNINIAWVRYKRDRMRGRVLHKLSLVMQKKKIGYPEKGQLFLLLLLKKLYQNKVSWVQI